LQKNSAALNHAAQKLHLDLTERAVGSIEESVDIVSSLTRHETTGVFLLCTHLFAVDEPAVRARNNKIPFYGCPNQIDALVSYAPDMYQLGQRGAWYVDQILKGAKPEGLPVETPRKFALTINLKTANAIGLTIPAEMLQRADKVIR
jgi:putative ABC transport system substrate-binding protein